MSSSTKAFDELLAQAESKAGPVEATEDLPMSPMRKVPGGNTRNVGQMLEPKLRSVWAEMQPFEDKDPVAFAKIRAEMVKRGFVQ